MVEEIYEEVELDLQKVKLYGFENPKEKKLVEEYMRHIADGTEFPPVIVGRIDDNTYRLLYERDPEDPSNFGGHHRALAHLYAKKPLPCVVKYELKGLAKNSIPLEAIILE